MKWQGICIDSGWAIRSKIVSRGLLFGDFLIGRGLVFDADLIGGRFGTGHFIAPFYLREAHAAQTVTVVLQRVEVLEFFHTNANDGAGPQKKVGMKTHAAGTVI